MLLRVSLNLANSNVASLNLVLPDDPAQFILSNVPLLQASSHLVKSSLILFDTLFALPGFFTSESRSTLTGFAFPDHVKTEPCATKCLALSSLKFPCQALPIKALPDLFFSSSTLLDHSPGIVWSVIPRFASTLAGIIELVIPG